MPTIIENDTKADTYRVPATKQKYALVNQNSPPHSIEICDKTENFFGPGEAEVPCDEDDKKPRSSGKVKLKFLNGLRGVASLMVVHVHAFYLRESSLAASGVDIFFVLSAFLLTMVNEAKVEKVVSRKESPFQGFITLVDYFAKRVLRVYPLFAAVAIALTCMPEETRNHYYNLSRYHIQHWSLWDILTMKERYYLFWTIPIEITYYFIIPIFLVIMALLGKFKWAVVLPLYVWVFYEGGYTQRTKHDAFRPHLSPFLAGSLAAIVHSELKKWIKHHHFELRRRHIAMLRLVELIFVSCMVSDMSRGLFTRWFDGSLFPHQHSRVPSICLPMSFVIVIEILAPSAISRCLEWNFLCYTGKISFSIYLLHPFVNFLPFLAELPRIDQFVVRLVLLYTLATISYHLIERNCQRLATIISNKLLRPLFLRRCLGLGIFELAHDWLAVYSSTGHLFPPLRGWE